MRCTYFFVLNLLFSLLQVELQAVRTGVKERAFVNTTVMEAKVPNMPEPTPEIVVCYIGWPGTLKEHTSL